jgi:fumarylacetoacetase
VEDNRQHLLPQHTKPQIMPALASWIAVDADSHFPLQNLPYGVFSQHGGVRHCATIVGDTVVDLAALYDAGVFHDIPELSENLFARESLNAFMEKPRPVWQAVRARLQSVLGAADGTVRDNAALCATALVPLSPSVTLHLPATVTEYTDFYSSREHATNVGIMFRGVENALQPNWLHLPVGYHGRASSVVVSGTEVVRPCGQVQKDAADPKAGSNFVACRSLDFELEMGAFLGGPANPLGTPVDMKEAENRIFGVVLLNDWSARDLQVCQWFRTARKLLLMTFSVSLSLSLSLCVCVLADVNLCIRHGNTSHWVPSQPRTSARPSVPGSSHWTPSTSSAVPLLLASPRPTPSLIPI